MLQRPPRPSAAVEWLQAADLACANLEVPLSHGGHPADKPIAFRADPALAPALAAMGLDVVSFANNHALDYGIPALLDTLEAVERAGVAVVGAGRDLAEACRPAILTVEGARVAFLAFASTLPVGSAATPERPGVAPVRVTVSLLADAPVLEEQPGTSPYVRTEALPQDVAAAQEAVAAARARADVVVVAVHWGVPPGWAAPFQGILADYQRPLGHALVEAGADLVLGHHPHTLHGLERYREAVICYSLGHFIFHSLAGGRPMLLRRPGPPYRLEAVRPPEVEESAVFLFTRRERGWTVEVRPCTMDAGGECVPVEGARAEAILHRVAVHSAALGSAVDVRGGRLWLEAR